MRTLLEENTGDTEKGIRRDSFVLVSRDNSSLVIEHLGSKNKLSLDTETTGLRPYHGDKAFSIIISNGDNNYYFNFQKYSDVDPEYILNDFSFLKPLLADPSKKWYLANAKYDMAILANHGLHLSGEIHDVLAVDRLIHNDEMSYSLASVAKRYGHEKSDAVEKYVTEHDLWSWREIPGKKTRSKDKDYFKVPLGIIQPYAEIDAYVTYHIGQRQEEDLERTSNETPEGLPTVHRVYSNELQLTKTVRDMEARGVRVDQDYCVLAVQHEQRRMVREILAFEQISGQKYKASPVLFAQIFASEKGRWKYTEKGNPSFESEILKTFENPAAKAVLGLRDAKARLDFFNGFLYHADSGGVVHPSFNQGGTATGRFSSSEPNFQNLADDDTSDFPVRRAIIPRPGYIFIMPDYDSMEYRLMLDYAGKVVGYETELISQVKAGKDVHQATADLVTESGLPLTRSKAKNANFATLYGSGIRTLAKTLGGTETEARLVKAAVFKAAPEIQAFIRTVTNSVSVRGSCFNWLGSVSKFPDSRFQYRAPNYLIQGGCADIVKVAMNRVHDYLQTTDSRMVMTIHDELVVEVAKAEALDVSKKVAEIMESVYPATYLPMKVSMEWSDKSLSDKQKGFPV